MAKKLRDPEAETLQILGVFSFILAVVALIFVKTADNPNPEISNPVAIVAGNLEESIRVARICRYLDCSTPESVSKPVSESVSTSRSEPAATVIP